MKHRLQAGRFARAAMAMGVLGVCLARLVASAPSAQSTQSQQVQTPAQAAPPPAAPASMDMKTQPEETAVKQLSVDPALKARVDAYWASRMQMNLAAAYRYYDPTFRTAYSEAQFLQNFQRLLRFRPEYLGIETVALYPSGTVANVGVKLRTRPAELEGMELVSVSYEKWQKNGGTWYKQGEPLMPSP